jgi:predicted permease
MDPWERHVRQLLQDLRYGLRVLAKSPGLTLVIILSLAIGIGANTTVFSVADALLLKPLPYPNPDRLAILWLRSPGIGIPEDWPSPGQYLDVRQGNRSFEEMAICIGDSLTLTGRDRPERIEAIRASSTLMALLGAKPALGRVFSAADDASGRQPVVLLTNEIWKRLFNSDSGIVGRNIVLNGNSLTVAGVLQSDFLLNHEVVPTVAGIDKADVLISLPLAADAQTKQRGDENYNILARVKPGVTFRQAQADVDVIAARIREADKRDRTFTISVVPLQEQVVGNVKRSLLVLLGSVALVLLIACANVANLLLSRAAGRQKEVAIRTALGAGASRVVRQLLTESLLLAVLGGAAGVLIAAWSLYVLHTIHPGNIPRLETITLDAGVLAFTFVISIVTGVLFGLAPALRALGLDLNTALKAGGRASQGAGGFHIGRHRLRGLLVVTELALSLMLLIGAGLLLRSFLRLQDVPPGFNPDHVLSAQLSLTGPKYRQRQLVATAYQEILGRISRLAGVKAAGGVSTLPFTSSVGWGSVQIEGYVPPPNEPELQVDQRAATTDYFRAMEIPLIQGRAFNDHDTPDAPQVVVIDQKMAKRFWPNESATGKRMRFGTRAPWMTVVGVVGTVKQYGLNQDLRMVVYFAHTQRPFNGMYLVARTAQDPATLASSIAREIHAVEPGAPVYSVRTMDQRIYDSLARERFSTTMLTAFAGFAMLLGGIGIYGVMSYLVTQGTHDLGVRIALGASRGSILNLVVRQGMALASLGIAAGLVGALALTRVMSSLLFHVSATDAATFSGVALFVAAIALLASYVPAWRATRVDPLVALRDE